MADLGEIQECKGIIYVTMNSLKFRLHKSANYVHSNSYIIKHFSALVIAIQSMMSFGLEIDSQTLPHSCLLTTRAPIMRIVNSCLRRIRERSATRERLKYNVMVNQTCSFPSLHACAPGILRLKMIVNIVSVYYINTGLVICS